jgi:glycosyltransferase involved in cell wall biosynthesis
MAQFTRQNPQDDQNISASHPGLRPAPLVTLILLFYKQEGFIHEAVMGALNQTYSPLEIILSDDCSPDRTFEILQDLVKSYEGPHKIILNRNPTNLRVCENLNAAIALSSGELIVTAGGDDICYPNRCEVLAEEWLKPERKWHSICSNANLVNERGDFLGVYMDLRKSGVWESAGVESALQKGFVGVTGCTHAFSRSNYETFGPLPATAPGEDEILGFRSLLLGGIKWIPDLLLSYRKHPGGLYKDLAALRRMDKAARLSATREDHVACKLRFNLYLDYIRVASEKGLITPHEADTFKGILVNRLPYQQFSIDCKGSIFFAASRLVSIIASGEYRSGMLTHFKHTFLRFGIRTFMRRICGSDKSNDKMIGQLNR